MHKLAVDNKGRLNLDEYAKLLSDKVAVVSVMWANNETGTYFPVIEMAKMADEAGCYSTPMRCKRWAKFL